MVVPKKKKFAAPPMGSIDGNSGGPPAAFKRLVPNSHKHFYYFNKFIEGTFEKFSNQSTIEGRFWLILNGQGTQCDDCKVFLKDRAFLQKHI
jgi:hypothetical protein